MTTVTRPEAPASAARRDRDARRALTFKQKVSRFDVKASPYFYIAPFFILFGLVGLFPLIYTFVVSLNNWNLLTGPGEWVGFANYLTELKDPFFWNSLFNTVSIFLLSAIPQLIGAVFIAAMLDQNIRAKTFWRMSVLLPFVVAPVAVGLIFTAIFADNFGLVNTWLNSIGIDGILWHKDPLASHVAIATMVNFRWIGYNTLIFLAAMQAVPRDLYEAAILDGAARMRQFFSITVPMLRPTIIFVVVTSTIGGLQIFDEPRMYDQFGQGGADRQWLTVTMYLYELGWGAQKSFGRAAAVAWILFLIIVAVGIVNFSLTRRISTDSAPKSGRKAKR